MRQLPFTFGPGTLKHLGSLMYGGGLVKPVAELVANAWDADASQVEVSLPTPTRGTFEVADNGHGMTWDECKDRYLTVGPDRRVLSGDKTRSGSRFVMGRKGIGKLAVISAARVVEVETVALNPDKKLWLTRFQIPYGELLSNPKASPAKCVKMLDDGPAPPALRFPGNSKTGTRTKLLDFTIGKLPNIEQFVESMYMRFAQFSKEDKFAVVVNGTQVPTVEEAIDAEDYEFKWEGTHQVSGVGEVEWWIGFTAEPQPNEERQGIGIYAHKRMAVERPFFFNLTKGFTGQLSKEYMTGVVRADALDETEDLIASDRGNINWSHPVAVALQEWGQQLVRTHAARWEEERGKRKLETLAPDPQLVGMINRLSKKPRDECNTLLRRLAKIPHVTKADIDRTARVLLNGVQHDDFREMLASVNESRADELPKLLQEWSILEAILFLPVVKSRIDVIRKLEQLIEDVAPEFPDIFVHLKENPELLRPEWQPLAWNKWMDTIVVEVFKGSKAFAGGQKRPDILCLSDTRNFVIVELKRPKLVVTPGEAQTFLHYMRRINEEVEKDSETRGARVEGLMICDALDPDADFLLNERADVKTKPWKAILQDAERQHQYILDRTADRVPGDDPRVTPYLDDPPKKRAVRVKKKAPAATKNIPTKKTAKKAATIRQPRPRQPRR